jgi:hypothetical protein
VFSGSKLRYNTTVRVMELDLRMDYIGQDALSIFD